MRRTSAGAAAAQASTFALELVGRVGALAVGSRAGASSQSGRALSGQAPYTAADDANTTLDGRAASTLAVPARLTLRPSAAAPQREPEVPQHVDARRAPARAAGSHRSARVCTSLG